MAKNKKKSEDETIEEAETEADAGANGDGTKKKYETMILGVSKLRKPKREALDNIAKKLGCKASDLVWAGIDSIIANPPKTAPQGATQTVGTAAGFWTVKVTDTKGRVTAVKVVEVDSRGELSAEDGARTFFRFKRGDVKERGRAKAQAMRAAVNDQGLIGIKAEVVVDEFETSAAADASAE